MSVAVRSEMEAAAEQQGALLRQVRMAHEAIRGELSNRIVGQGGVLDDLLTAVFARGHALLVGVPGLAKTLIVSTLGEVLSLQFRRIQFTPDLLPSDITGNEVLEEDRTTGKRVFRFVRGPVFTNLLLADEINRTPPKTQAALLQAMAERHVTVSGTPEALPEPFFVLATQNPIEQEGTYPLPEAQLDRFMFSLRVDYPSAAEELAIALRTTGAAESPLSKILTGQQVVQIQELVRRVPVSEHVAGYAVKVVRATRPGDETAPAYVKQYVKWGAGPRAVQYLVLGAKARAVLEGTANVSVKHVREVAGAVLRHRVLMNFAAESDGVSADVLVGKVMGEVRE
jgi:MoxR-like ATPase